MIHTTERVLTNRSPWFKQWFDTDYYHKLYANHDEEEAQNFMDTLILRLNPSQCSSMIDVGCGKGRHSKYLASKGFDVTGIDLSFASISQAKKFEMDSLHFIQHDMRHPFGKNRYDYVFNLFTSFGYFKSDDENQLVIKNMSEALKPEATLVLDYLNVTYAEDHLVPEEVKEIEGIIYHIRRWMTDTHFYKKISISENGTEQSVEFTEKVAQLNLDQFEYMMALHDLEIEELYGDYQLSIFDSVRSPRLMIKAKKIGD